MQEFIFIIAFLSLSIYNLYRETWVALLSCEVLLITSLSVIEHEIFSAVFNLLCQYVLSLLYGFGETYKYVSSA